MQSLFLKHRTAPVITGTTLAIVITTALVSVGAFSEGALPQGFSSYRQLLGINILLIAMPSYLVLAWGLQHRRSAALLAQVDEMLPGSEYRSLLNAPLSVMVAGAGLGAIYAIFFNLPVGSLAELLGGGSLMICLVTMMILVWVTVGLVIASRLHVSGLFRTAGTDVPIDPFDQSTLEPFARAGMGDVMLTAGALVLSTVQSIDAMFRYENYFYALAVAVPAGAMLVLRPMTTIHKRLNVLKKQELASVNGLIRAAPKTIAAEDMAMLEPLLQRRDRINAVHTWPLNVSMISRLLIYGVIPPAAWVGAALVERMVEDLLGG